MKGPVGPWSISVCLSACLSVGRGMSVPLLGADPEQQAATTRLNISKSQKLRSTNLCTRELTIDAFCVFYVWNSSLGAAAFSDSSSDCVLTRECQPNLLKKGKSVFPFYITAEFSMYDSSQSRSHSPKAKKNIPTMLTIRAACAAL